MSSGKVKSKPGTLGAILLFVTALHRFANEYYRGDERGSFLGSDLSLSQGIALCLMGGSLLILALIALRPHKENRHERLV